jgi:hypothetical protein
VDDLAADGRDDDQAADDGGDRVVAGAPTDLSFVPTGASSVQSCALRRCTRLCIPRTACGHAWISRPTSRLDVA